VPGGSDGKPKEYETAIIEVSAEEGVNYENERYWARKY
jgi:hypothetical protein